MKNLVEKLHSKEELKDEKEEVLEGVAREGGEEEKEEEKVVETDGVEINREGEESEEKESVKKAEEFDKALGDIIGKQIKSEKLMLKEADEIRR